METSLSGKDLAKMGFSFVERELLFVIERPEFYNLTPYLRGTYRTCPAVKSVEDVVELDEAYDHIFVRDGGCDWCKQHFESLKKPLLTLAVG